MRVGVLTTGRSIEKLLSQGYCCSQILVALALQNQSKTNWDLVRSMEGLKGGLGGTGAICGAITGAACVIGLYAGRGPAEEKTDNRLTPMIQDLVTWFGRDVGKIYGGVRCEDITRNRAHPDALRICNSIITKVHLKITDILVCYGFELERGRR
jgi:C_GCAxxG_C_C family probable redox protein